MKQTIKELVSQFGTGLERFLSKFGKEYAGALLAAHGLDDIRGNGASKNPEHDREVEPIDY